MTTRRRAAISRREFLEWTLKAGAGALVLNTLPGRVLATGTPSITLPISLDVLIVGGGVQGLWTLRLLRGLGYSAALVERGTLGGAQTCHSHVYIHGGHLYQGDFDLATRLRDANTEWAAFTRAAEPARGVVPSIFGFSNEEEAAERLAFWDDPRLRLPYDRTDVPTVLQGGVISQVFKTPEYALNGGSLVRKLDDSPDSMSRINEIRRIHLTPDDGSVSGVDMMMADGRAVTIQPGAVVLAAGAGNQRLLELVSQGDRTQLARSRGVQHIRKAHMLVVKGPKRRLPPLAGIFPKVGALFIGSRVVGDDVVWLVSDDRSPHLEEPEDWITYDEKWWLPRTIQSLEKLAPRTFENKEGLLWGVYAAPKAEVRTLAFEIRRDWVQQFGIRNLWAVWPAKLTLAPLAAREVASAISTLLGKPRPELLSGWRDVRIPVSAASELWERTALIPWKEFRQSFDLAMAAPTLRRGSLRGPQRTVPAYADLYQRGPTEAPHVAASG
jgi:glycine/D-amino acid oxidase-like deaminating enzyme